MSGIKLVCPGVFEYDPSIEGDDLERLASLIRLSHLPAETRLTKRFTNFEDIPGRKAGLEAAMALLRGEIDPPLLLLYGLPGLSKTHLALAIAWSFILQLKTVCYYHVGICSMPCARAIVLEANWLRGNLALIALTR